MEFGALVAIAFLTGAKSTEVFTGLGDNIVVEVEFDAALLVCEDVSEEIQNGVAINGVATKSNSDVGERWGN